MDMGLSDHPMSGFLIGQDFVIVKGHLSDELVLSIGFAFNFLIFLVVLYVAKSLLKSLFFPLELHSELIL